MKRRAWILGVNIITLVTALILLCLNPNIVISQDYEITQEWLYDGSPDSETRATPFGLIEADDGGLIIGSSTWSGCCIRVFKVDRNGEIIWDFNRRLGAHNLESPALIKIEDGKIIVVVQDGDENDHYRLICLNENGDDDERVLWEKIYRFQDEIYHFVNSVFPAEDEQFVMLGCLPNGESYDEVIILFNAEGDTLQTRKYSWDDRPDRPFGINDGCFSNNNYVFTGSRTVDRYPQPSPSTGLLFAVDENLDSLTWNEFLPDFYCRGKLVIPLPDSNLLVCGSHLVSEGNDPGWYLNGFAAKFDSEWNSIWHREFVPERSHSNYVYDCLHLGDGMTMITTTWSGRGAWLLILNNNGDIVGEIIDYGMDYATIHLLLITECGEIYALGSTRDDFFGNENRLWVLRISNPNDVGYSDEVISPNRFTLYSPYPNPFNTTCKIPYYLDAKSDVQIKVFDISGQECVHVLMEEKRPGKHTFQLGKQLFLGNLPTGNYFINFRTVEGSLTKRFTYLK